jgi:hypothetical protein
MEFEGTHGVEKVGPHTGGDLGPWDDGQHTNKLAAVLVLGGQVTAPDAQDADTVLDRLKGLKPVQTELIQACVAAGDVSPILV